MSNCCDTAKIINVTQPVNDFWRSNALADLPDGASDITEEIARTGPIAVGVDTPTANKIATFAGDIDVQGEIDPSSMVYSDPPAGVVTAFNSAVRGYYRLGVIGVQRPIVALPKTDVINAVQVRKADATTVVWDVDTLNERVGVRVADPRAALDVNGAQILRQVDLPDFAASAAIGTAAATVDLYSTVAVAQATSDIVLTIPNPTETTAGRILAVLNTGTSQFKVGGVYVSPNTGASFIWSGATWIPMEQTPEVVTVAASRDLTPADHLKTLLATAALTLTVPTGLGYLICRVRQGSAAAIATIAAGAGMTLVVPSGDTTPGTNGGSGIIEVNGTTVWFE